MTSTGSVNTVRGSTSANALGRTLMHEHILAVSAALANDRPEIAYPDGKEATIVYLTDLLQKVKDSGIDTIVDLTVFGHDRDIPALVELNKRVDLNIVVATGFYTDDEPAKTFAVRQMLAKMFDKPNFYGEVFTRDITQGIGTTGVRAGVIKCVTDTLGLTEHITDLLVGAAIACKETGVPISTHTNAASQNGLDQIKVFTDQGVDLSRVIIGHSGDTTDLDYLKKIMDTGATIGSDRFGFYAPGTPGLEARVETIAKLCEQGYADRIVLAHDSMMHTDWMIPEFVNQHPKWVPTHISDDVIPALRAAGVPETQLHDMLVRNPARLLARAA
ncbi:phosphotriesterase family protein [Paenarthrobacter nicotinovorans]|uniref:phosphotriesterase family protein n=1 Tax=Paenarthrobacter nicotinovorans TaxID=29320 RepID=UPI003D679EC8